ncbi:LicD family protein [Streptococcus marimammalium]|uniref:LicD family protein n=1 Tax=Streptococcus marimammalium TaxID=269666 RepID=UPI0003605729|nr:LicD family protein [Streptococcus marimammalium]
MNNNIKLVQSIELEMLKEFHEISKKLNIRYYALGGTLLGAVRHSGFIPWDDDIDIGIPREDYEKFIQLAPKKLSKHIIIKPNPLNLNILQLVNTNTKIKIGDIETGVFIDIFPLDGYPETFVKRFLHSKKIILLRMLAKLSVINLLIERDRGMLENTIFKIAKITNINRILSSEKILSKLHETIKKYSFEKSSLVGNILGRYRNREIVLKNILGTPQLIKFECIDIYAPEKADCYLKQIYDDYMIIPDLIEQKGHDIEIICIKKS